MRRPGRKVLRRIGLVAIGILVAVIAAASAADLRPWATPVTGTDAIEIPVSDLQPGKVKFFSYRSDAGSRIRFLLARDADGHVEGAFDACEHCYSFHKGYKSSGGFLICRVCGNRYRLGKLSNGMASCVPAKLAYKESDQTIQIRTEDLKRGGAMF
jgi:uncharacterized membrane protein